MKNHRRSNLARLARLALGTILTFAALIAMGATVAWALPSPHPNPPPTTTTETTPPPPTTPTPPGDTCVPPDPPGGKDGNPGHDECVPDPTPPVQTTPTPPVVVPPALNCPANMTEVGRTATQVTCSTTIVRMIVKTRTKTKVVIKKVKQPPKVILRKYCPKPRNGHKLAG